MTNTRRASPKNGVKKAGKTNTKSASLGDPKPTIVTPPKKGADTKSASLGDSKPTFVTPPKKRAVIDYSQRKSNETQVFMPKVSACQLNFKRRTQMS